MRSATWGAGVLALVVVAGCSSSGGKAVGNQDQPWKGATALTGQEDHAFGVVLDGLSVLFATGGSQVGENAIRRVPLDGSTPSAILVPKAGDDVPSGLMAVDGEVLYAAVGSTIVRYPITGGAGTVVVARRPAIIRSLAIDATNLWWSTSELNTPAVAEVATAAKDGSGVPEVVATPTDGSGSFSTVILDGHGGAYAASPAGIVHVAHGTPAALVVSSDAAKGAVTRVARNGDHLFGTAAGAGLFTVPTGGGTPVVLAKTADDVRDVQALADGVAYFDHDTLRYVPTAGGAPVVLASGKYAEGSLAVTGRTVVFAADWKIWKASLPS